MYQTLRLGISSCCCAASDADLAEEEVEGGGGGPARLLLARRAVGERLTVPDLPAVAHGQVSRGIGRRRSGAVSVCLTLGRASCGCGLPSGVVSATRQATGQTPLSLASRISTKMAGSWPDSKPVGQGKARWGQCEVMIGSWPDW